MPISDINKAYNWLSE